MKYVGTNFFACLDKSGADLPTIVRLARRRPAADCETNFSEF